MNWGKGIIIFMASFMTFILWMVFTLMSKNTDLESEDYYKKEIAYEQEIQAQRNANDAKEKVKVSENKDFIILQFPLEEKIDTVSVEFFKPNDKNGDQLFAEVGTKTMMVDKKKLQKGLYLINIHYQIEDKEFLQKEEIMLK
jgi:hypothetical protein